MAGQNPFPFRRKAAVTVTEMARMVGLSKTRFYEYIKRGIFPWPLYSITNRRPFYPADIQEEILTTRQTGLTPSGGYVLFYEKRPDAMKAAPARSPAHRPAAKQLIDGLKSLGMVNVTATQVEDAFTACFPNQNEKVEETLLLRTIYRHLRRSGIGQ